MLAIRRERDPVPLRLQAEEAVVGGRVANRAGAVGGVRDRAHARGRRDPASPARPGTGPRGIPWVAGVAPGRALREAVDRQLRQVGLAEDRRAGVAEASHDQAVLGRRLAVGSGAMRGHLTGVIDVVLDRDRYAEQRGIVALGQPLLGALGVGARALREDDAVGVQLWFHRRDPPEVELDELARRDLLGANHLRNPSRAGVGDVIAHLPHAIWPRDSAPGGQPSERILAFSRSNSESVRAPASRSFWSRSSFAIWPAVPPAAAAVEPVEPQGRRPLSCCAARAWLSPALIRAITPPPPRPPIPAFAVAVAGPSSRLPRPLRRRHSESSRAGTPISRKVPPTITPPSWPPLESWIAWSVRDTISDVAPVAAKKSPHANSPKLKSLPLLSGLSLSHGGSPRNAKIPAPIKPPKIPATSSRMSVPVPEGQGWEIWYGVFPEAHVPVCSKATSFTLKRTIPPTNMASPSGALIR